MGNKDSLSAAAATLGKKGGKATTPKKQKASRENGRLGGNKTSSSKK